MPAGSSSSSSTRLKSKERAPMEGALSLYDRFTSQTYISDYLALALLVCLNITLAFVEPFHRLFSLDDRRIQYPHADPERVSFLLCVLYASLLPLCLITAYILLLPSSSPKAHKLHVSLLGLFLALSTSTVLVDTIKNFVGRARPDLIARCQPREGTPEHELIDFTICTQTDHHTLHDGWRSFPSGHSAFSFCGLGYLSLFLVGQLGALKVGAGYFRVLASAWPLVGALLIALSRTMDYRHDVWDVCTGSVIGGVTAWAVYRRFYPGLRKRDADVPYVKSERDTEGFERVEDLEMQEVRGARRGV